MSAYDGIIKGYSMSPNERLYFERLEGEITFYVRAKKVIPDQLKLIINEMMIHIETRECPNNPPIAAVLKVIEYILDNKETIKRCDEEFWDRLEDLRVSYFAERRAQCRLLYLRERMIRMDRQEQQERQEQQRSLEEQLKRKPEREEFGCMLARPIAKRTAKRYRPEDYFPEMIMDIPNSKRQETETNQQEQQHSMVIGTAHDEDDSMEESVTFIRRPQMEPIVIEDNEEDDNMDCCIIPPPSKSSKIKTIYWVPLEK